MSYDIYLKERATGETIELPVKHIMTGGTCCADYDEITGLFTVQAITEAWLNVTYNYTQYFCDATEGDSRFYGKEKDKKLIVLISTRRVKSSLQKCVKNKICLLKNIFL